MSKEYCSKQFLNECEYPQELKDKIQFFEKWLALGTPFESAKFDHSKVLAEYRKLFSDMLIPRNQEQPKEETKP